MNTAKNLLACVFILIPTLIVSAFSTASATMESSYDIAELYEVKEPLSGTKAIDVYGKASSVEYLLTPIKLDTGKYVVEVKKSEIIFTRLRIQTFALKQGIVTNGLHSQKR